MKSKTWIIKFTQMKLCLLCRSEEFVKNFFLLAPAFIYVFKDKTTQIQKSLVSGPLETNQYLYT